MKKTTYWMEDIQYKIKRYFTVESGKVVGTEASEKKLADFLTIAEMFHYKFERL